MSAECRICHKIIPNKGNHAFYCDACAEVWRTQGAKRYRLGNSKNCVWVRNNTIIRAVIEGKDVEPIYVSKEIIE